MKKVIGVNYKDYTNTVNMLNRILASGNTESAKPYEEKLLAMVEPFGVMDPKLVARLNFLRSEKNPEYDEELKGLEVAEKECFIKFYKEVGSQVRACIKAEIGEDKTLKLNRREKIRVNYNGVKTAQAWSGSQLMPGIRFFEYPVVDYSESDLAEFEAGTRKSLMSSNSTVAIAITTEEDEVTEQPIVRVRFFSLIYDSIDKKYNTHEWLVTFNVVKAIPKDKVAEADQELENTLDDWA